MAHTLPIALGIKLVSQKCYDGNVVNVFVGNLELQESTLTPRHFSTSVCSLTTKIGFLGRKILFPPEETKVYCQRVNFAPIFFIWKYPNLHQQAIPALAIACVQLNESLSVGSIVGFSGRCPRAYICVVLRRQGSAFLRHVLSASGPAWQP